MNNAPLRINRGQSVRSFNGQSTTIQGSPYFERLVKLIPGEIISIYIFGVGLIPKTDTTTLWIWPIICLAMLIVLRVVTTKTAPSITSAQWTAVLISSISFAIWLYTIGGIFETLSWYKAYIGSLVVLVWTFFVPFVYKGD